MQDRLNTMIGKSSGFVETLPVQVQARIQALRDLQVRLASAADCMRRSFAIFVPW